MASAYIGLSEKSNSIEEWEVISARQANYKPKPLRTYFSVDSFMWTDTEYTPRQLIDNFHHLTPFLVLTTQAYTGRDESTNTIAYDEVFWVRGVIKVRRLVLKNAKNAYFSVPITDKFTIQPHKGGEPVGERTNLKKFCMEGTYGEFRFVDEGRLTVFQGAGSGESLRLGVLRIMDQYDERHLIAHSLISGSIYHESCIIPIYMPITMSIAAAMDTNDHKHFYRTMLEVFNFINKVPKAVAFPRALHNWNEIMIYQARPPEGEYDFLHYVKVNAPGRNDTPSQTYESLTVEKHGPETPDRKKSDKKGQNIVNQGSTLDKSRCASPTPGTEPLDQRGGARGSGSNIYDFSQQGYGVVDVEPRHVLNELVDVLSSDKIPERSRVSKKVISPCKDKGTTPRSQYPSKTKPLPTPANADQMDPHQNNIRSENSGKMLEKSGMPKKVISPCRDKGTTPGSQYPSKKKHLPTPANAEQMAPQQSNISSVNQGKAKALVEELKERGQLPLPASTTPKSVKTKMQTAQPKEASSVNNPDYNRKVDRNGHSVRNNTYEPIPADVHSPLVLGHAQRANQWTDDITRVSKQDRPPSPPPLRPHDVRDTSLNLNVTSGVSMMIQTIADIPRDISHLDTDGIGQCLVLLNLGKHRMKFSEEQVDGCLIADLDESVLTDEFKFSIFEARKLIKFVNGWRPAVQ